MRWLAAGLGVIALLTPQPAGAGSSLGQLRTVRPPRHCIQGYACVNLEVHCPGVQTDAVATVASAAADGIERGVLVAFSGSDGRDWFNRAAVTEDGLAELRRDGIRTVMVAWRTVGWSQADPGETVGPPGLACRPATVIHYLRAGFTADPAAPLGACGFCVTGVSGGASQLGYGLAVYGMDADIDAAFPMSGPPHAAIDKGCLDEPGYAYSDANRATIDASYGWFDGSGPCAQHDSSWGDRFAADSASHGTDLMYPSTRVHFLFGALDAGPAVDQGEDFERALVSAGSPLVSDEVVPTAGHAVQRDPGGMAALVAAVTATQG